MKLAPAAANAVIAATTPEEAAKVFSYYVSQGLAAIVADAIDKALNSVASASPNPATAGWESLVGGMAMQLTWASPIVIKPQPVIHTTAFCPYPSTMPITATAMGVSVGISVTANF